MAGEIRKNLGFLFIIIGIFLVAFGTSARYCNSNATNCGPVIYFFYLQPEFNAGPGIVVADYLVNLLGGFILLSGLALAWRRKSSNCF